MVCRNRRIGMSLAVLSLLTATSCASYPATGTYVNRNSELLVQNRGWETVTVYAVRGPVSIRIGSVDGMSARTFLLNSSIIGPGGAMQLRGRRRISGEEFLSHWFDMTHGSNASWIVEQTASLSQVKVR